jgi:hypothetical protein
MEELERNFYLKFGTSRRISRAGRLLLIWFTSGMILKISSI